MPECARWRAWPRTGAIVWREWYQALPGRIEALSVNPARVVSPDVAEIGRFEGLELDSWESTSSAKMPAAGHVDEGRTRVGEGWHAAGHVRPRGHDTINGIDAVK